MDLTEILVECCDDAIVYPDLKEAMIGIVERFGMSSVALYDYNKVIQILMESGMTHEEAVEWYGFNTLGTWAGDGTPAFARIFNQPLLDELY
jgi:hypothetical protein